ncbi:MAG: HupE/UreJ family protein [Thiogranum sp.]|nr:HupE/UreJ family protein [Thiogranum sp.]
MKRTTFIAGLITLTTLLAAQPATAHTLTGALGGVSSGLAHPFLGIDHMLAMLAVGLWAAQLGGGALWKVPLAFVGTMLIGAWLGLSGIYVPFTEAVIAASVLVLGLAISLQWRLVPLLAGLMVGTFALFHGFAHGGELPLAASPVTYFAGCAVATATLLGLRAAAVCLLFARAQTALVRAGGAGLAGAGLWLLIAI